MVPQFAASKAVVVRTVLTWFSIQLSIWYISMDVAVRVSGYIKFVIILWSFMLIFSSFCILYIPPYNLKEEGEMIEGKGKKRGGKRFFLGFAIVLISKAY